MRTGRCLVLVLLACHGWPFALGQTSAQDPEPPAEAPAPRRVINPTEAAVTELKKEQEAARKAAGEAKQAAEKGIDDAKVKGDTAWMLTSSGLVMLMVPGL